MRGLTIDLDISMVVEVLKLFFVYLGFPSVTHQIRTVFTLPKLEQD